MSSILYSNARPAWALAAFLTAAISACSPDKPTAPRVSVPAGATAAVGQPQRGCSPKCTPDRILFVKADYSPTTPWNGHIWVMNADTTAKTQITFGNADDDHPAWSPTFKKVVFSTNRRGSYEIFVVNADGTGLSALTSAANQSMDLYPTWAPDGSKIYFSRLTPDLATASWRGEIYSVNPNGSGLTKVSNDAASLYFPSVSPDGKKVAVVRLPLGAAWDQARLYTMNPDGTGMAMLTDGWTGDGEPAWSPDGSKVAFTCHEGFPDQRDICTVNADGTDRKYIVMWQGQQANPTFSRDGTRIVFESYGSGNGMLFSVKPDGTGSIQLTPLDRNAYYSAAWSR
jgi:TolB protein